VRFLQASARGLDEILDVGDALQGHVEDHSQSQALTPASRSAKASRQLRRHDRTFQPSMAVFSSL